mmetsp:Transcript_92379/g.197985  ORF Transcript_92379/g.197985 Transcript_92379/m.197985 type:complete len:484 (-) Transcript_92379:96-1547(-)
MEEAANSVCSTPSNSHIEHHETASPLDAAHQPEAFNEEAGGLTASPDGGEGEVGSACGGLSTPSQQPGPSQDCLTPTWTTPAAWPETSAIFASPSPDGNDVSSIGGETQEASSSGGGQSRHTTNGSMAPEISFAGVGASVGSFPNDTPSEMQEVAAEANGTSWQTTSQTNGASASEENSKGAAEDVKEQLDTSELVLLDLIGSGAQAEVYKAIWWRSFGSTTSAITVAIKRLHGGSPQRAFDCESLTRKVSHPNLVRCFEATSKAPYLIVSEFCAGGSLYDCMHERADKWSWQQRLKILWDIAKGMEHLHNLDPIIVHRDLKSCNVLLAQPISEVNQQPTAKVADFGLSRVLRSSSTFLTRCVGTWRWMAPEVFSTNEYDERIDVFSFGILMFEVLTRKIPYADLWPVNSTINPRIGLFILKGQRPNIQLVQNGCPGKVVQLMQECWASNPADRPNFTTVKEQLQSQLELVTLYMQVKKEVTF